jgi:hypothetical protein
VRARVVALGSIAAVMLVGLPETAEALPPAVLLFNPTSGPVGTAVTITGTGFQDASTVTSVTFNGTSASFTVTSTTQIDATVPAGATTGPIAVTDGEGTFSTLTDFTVSASPPAVGAFVPVTGPEGTSVSIAGLGFTGATDVSFNGTSASFTVTNDTVIDATVPTDATTGPISVTTPGGSDASAVPFTVTAPGSPVVLAFAPTSGHVQTVVQLGGTGLTGATGVTFNGTSASFSVDSDSAITATVPSGATTGPIDVVTPAGTGASAIDFTITDAVDRHDRVVSLRTRGSLALVGRVSVTTGFARCARRVRVVAMRRRPPSERRAWQPIATAKTRKDGRYVVPVPGDPGKYEVVAPKQKVNGGLDVCKRAVSRPRRWGG